MADARRVVRQWLETEAALGMTEVPLRAGTRVERSIAKPEVTPARKSVAAAVAALRTPPAAPAALIPEAVAPAAPKAGRRKGPDLPAAPAGDISALPPLSSAEKAAALAELRHQAEEAARPYINDIATKLVFGEGDPAAELMFVGEGPGAEEDRTGRPFVGRSGQLLDKMIVAMGFSRAQVYIGNVVKLRCAEREDTGYVRDRPPTPEEAARGLPFLHRQIEIIQPKVLVTLGAPAIKYLTGTTQGIMSIRGTWMNYRGIPVMPTYHPSFVLRSYTQENRRKVWEDLQQAMKLLGRKPGKGAV